ncbi:hypothetical protein VTL71DRAFT_3984 [Oculimacula yallundae]|uniref:Uncharacterized protein n=1 Tax=Oculimacula yallundae TaxID=86028 RepID=A0ABR4C4K8_9HELO
MNVSRNTRMICYKVLEADPPNNVGAGGSGKCFKKHRVPPTRIFEPPTTIFSNSLNLLIIFSPWTPSRSDTPHLSG